ncbi:Oidioi.mRNA.OKI2018_I69.chr2.g8317.t1.cds [Oikopleura dioica]|uniref:Oidioi.mRNA.OKI2018_I69.chr2.g8317.t1.cds n=1 Tax=Oikopleura dioica TaxID=34765 RepID=A0ABN7TB48_OIKDI|nr:Oidioi.mRNA.OKI2018_I69.chr2.g8317.t1.cds [Oikopleura dioica]
MTALLVRIENQKVTFLVNYFLILEKAAQKAQIDAYKKGMFDTLPPCYTTDFMKLTIEGTISPMENIELLRKYGYPDDSSPVPPPPSGGPSSQITDAVANQLQLQTQQTTTSET